jgi:hypothetical protein
VQQQKVKATKTEQHVGQDYFLSIRTNLLRNLFGLQHLAHTLRLLVYMLQKAMASVQPFREGRYQRLAILQLFDVFGLWTLHAYSRLDPRYVLLRIPSISAKERDAQFRNCECNIARSFQHS